VQAWGRRDDRWPMALGKLQRQGRRNAGQGIPVPGDGPEWPIGPRWADHRLKQGGPREEKKRREPAVPQGRRRWVAILLRVKNREGEKRLSWLGFYQGSGPWPIEN
jgi:hypothetical protein